ncbi:MAG TPA: sugar ABC transporter permease [Chloroflexia bacterium]|nr:sugar ABC transporter permease [Chloroflexia bacterium]
MNSRRQALQGMLFVLPAMLLLAIFLVYPTLWTIALSFDRGRGLRFEKFVGLDNFINLLTRDRLFINLARFPPSGAVINNVIWVVLNTSLCVGLGLLIAVLTDRVRYESIIKALVFLPMAIAATAVAVIWLFVYSPDPHIGLLNALLTTINPGFEPKAWTGQASTATYAVIIANVWAQTGFAMVVLSAALKGIPADIVEAARVDGANEWGTFRRITLPMLSLPISVVTVTLVIWVLKVFDIIYIMTAGGPAGSTRVIAYTMYVETFQGGSAGYGSAVAVIMLLLIIPIMILNIRRFRTEGVTR